MSYKGVRNLGHGSASKITAFIQRRDQFFVRYILGKDTPAAPAMFRGSAIETGVRFALLGDDLDASIERAHKDYDADVAKAGIMDLDGKVMKEREMIAPSVELAVEALAPFGIPSYEENGRQHKVSINCRYGDGEEDVLPIIGYLDFVFPDIIIDLKSTSRMPSEMSWTHQVQRAIYARATGKPVRFCYVTPKKCEFREDGDIKQLLEQVRLIVKAMDRFMQLDEETQWMMSIPDPDGYGWSGNEVVRKQLFGV